MGTYSTSERTRTALIHAAGELVAELGAGRVSTRAIAEKAGENLGTIHYHFGGKEELLKEMLRFACHSQAGPSLHEVIRSFEGHLNTPQQQAEAVQTVIRQFIQEGFSPDRPAWCSRVLFQMAQHEGPLRAFLRAEVLDPLLDAFREMFRAIKPGWTDPEIYSSIFLMMGPLVFHADHKEMILDRLGVDVIPADYLAQLGQRLVADTLRALGLPSDAVAAAPDQS